MRTSALLAALLLAGALWAAPNDLAKTAPAAWVKVADWKAPAAAAADAASDYEDLLRDYQINLATQEQYIHYAFRFLTSKAVQNDSTVSIDYAPDYQTVKLHTVNLWRGGKAINQKTIPFQSLQRETGLEASMYDGTKSWVGFLKDVRPGDVIEVAYTLQGDNPIFAGRYADTFHLQSSFAVDHWSLRLLAPVGQTPEIRAFHTDLAPQTKVVGNLEETALTADNVESVLVDDNSPIDSNPAARFVLSQWKNWADIVQWALPLYRVQPSPEVEAQAKELTKDLESTDEKLSALLTYVQDKIRYLGIEVGVNSHQPHPASEVLQNGFGDCKDKVVLFCGLAASLGLPAWPVLVDTRNGSLVSTDGPTPLAFNHVIAAVAASSGTVFVDPTEDLQGGSIDNRVLGPFDYGLELKDGVTDLTKLPGSSAGRRELVQTFHFTSFDGDALVSMQYTFTGADADSHRRRVEGATAAEWRKDENEWLHDQYGEANVTQGPDWKDDRDTNVFRVSFEFSLKGYWTLSGGSYKAEFYPSLIGESLYDPDKVGDRQQPYALEYPEVVRQVRRVELPADWKIQPADTTVSGPGFKVTAKARQVSPRVIEFTDVLTSLADRVEVADWKAYLDKLKKARSEVSWTLTHDAETAKTTDTAAPIGDSPYLAIGGTVAGVVLFLLMSALEGADF